MKYKPGDAITQKTRNGSHRYELMMVEQHTNRCGYPAPVLTWCGECVFCGASFAVKTSRRPRPYLTRTCEDHRGWRDHISPFDRATSDGSEEALRRGWYES